jgi:hypothetical protein
LCNWIAFSGRLLSAAGTTAKVGLLAAHGLVVVPIPVGCLNFGQQRLARNFPQLGLLFAVRPCPSWPARAKIRTLLELADQFGELEAAQWEAIAGMGARGTGRGKAQWTARNQAGMAGLGQMLTELAIGIVGGMLLQ